MKGKESIIKAMNKGLPKHFVIENILAFHEESMPLYSRENMY